MFEKTLWRSSSVHEGSGLEVRPDDGIADTPPGATPLSPEDLEGLIPTWIATKADLNRAEQANIAAASVWAFERKVVPNSLTDQWLKELHRWMLGDVWRWAGDYRRLDTNIGLPWYEIPTAVHELTLDVQAQAANLDMQAWPVDEIAVRFHHRLVSIHPFPDGNGRHARLAAEVLVVGLGGERFDWGAQSDLYGAGPAREEYLVALQEADSTADYSRLIAFARQTKHGR